MVEKTSEQFRQLLVLAQGKLPANEDTITGINLAGHPIQQGIYYFHRRRGIADRFSLTQDTLPAYSPFRGIIIENGVIVQAVGIGRSKASKIRSVMEIMNGFLGCQRYFQTNPQG